MMELALAKRPQRAAGMLAAAALLTLAGCAEGNWSTTGHLRDDVVAIHQFPPTRPWLEDEDGRVRGLCVRLYFISAETQRGVFVPGSMEVELFALAPRPEGGYERTLMHTWTLDQREAAGYRVTKRAVMGESYGLVLWWPPELDLAGREIQLMYHYKRKDGQVISKRSSSLLVPPPRRMMHMRPASPKDEPRPSSAPAERLPQPGRERQ